MRHKHWLVEMNTLENDSQSPFLCWTAACHTKDSMRGRNMADTNFLIDSYRLRCSLPPQSAVSETETSFKIPDVEWRSSTPECSRPRKYIFLHPPKKNYSDFLACILLHLTHFCQLFYFTFAKHQTNGQQVELLKLFKDFPGPLQISRSVTSRMSQSHFKIKTWLRFNWFLLVFSLKNSCAKFRDTFERLSLVVAV